MIEFMIHELPKSKETDIIEVRTSSQLPLDFIIGMRKALRACGHKGTIIILNKEDKIEFNVKGETDVESSKKTNSG